MSDEHIIWDGPEEDDDPAAAEWVQNFNAAVGDVGVSGGGGLGRFATIEIDRDHFVVLAHAEILHGRPSVRIFNKAHGWITRREPFKYKRVESTAWVPKLRADFLNESRWKDHLLLGGAWGVIGKSTATYVIVRDGEVASDAGTVVPLDAAGLPVVNPYTVRGVLEKIRSTESRARAHADKEAARARRAEIFSRVASIGSTVALIDGRVAVVVTSPSMQTTWVQSHGEMVQESGWSVSVLIVKGHSESQYMVVNLCNVVDVEKDNLSRVPWRCRGDVLDEETHREHAQHGGAWAVYRNGAWAAHCGEWGTLPNDQWWAPLTAAGCLAPRPYGYDGPRVVVPSKGL